MPETAGEPACVRCGREVRVGRGSYEFFERMHLRFHYEFEGDPFGPDEECAAGGCPSSPRHSAPKPGD